MARRDQGEAPFLERGDGRPSDAENAILLEIGRFQKWFDRLHPFIGANRRMQYLPTNMLLCEHGFCPS